MKRVTWGILILMAVLLGTQQASGDTISLTYLSGGVTAYATIEDNYQKQYDPIYANASQQSTGLYSQDSSAARATSSGGYYVSLLAQAESSLNDYYVGAQGYTAGGPNGNPGFILLQVTDSSGMVGNPGQISYGFYNDLSVNVPNWEYSGGYFPLVITINGVTMFNNYFWGGGFLNVNVGDIIGISCHVLVDNLSHTGEPLAGGMMSDLYVSLEPVNPVPLPPTVLLLGSGLLGLVGWRRFKKN